MCGAPFAPQKGRHLVRRGRHEGGITKRYDRNDKLIGYQVQVRLPGGQRKTLGTVPTMREARLLAQQGQVDVASGRLSGNKRQKLDDYLCAWIASKKPGLAPSTHVSYDLNRRRLEPYCGSVRLDVLRPKDIQQAYAGLTEQGLKPKSVQQGHRLLHAALQDAVRLGLVPMNVVDSTSPPRNQLNEMKTLTAPQLLTLFKESRDDPLHALWVVLATTGLRLGEALGLRWGDIDLDAGRRPMVVLSTGAPHHLETGTPLRRLRSSSIHTRWQPMCFSTLQAVKGRHQFPCVRNATIRGCFSSTSFVRRGWRSVAFSY
jgi:integrase